MEFLRNQISSHETFDRNFVHTFCVFRECRKDLKELKLCLIDFSISNEMMEENKHVTIAQSW